MSTPLGIEKTASRTTKLSLLNETVEVGYRIFGATDDLSAKDTLISNAPGSWAGVKGTLVPSNYAVDEKVTAGGYYEGVVTYNMPDWIKSTGETSFNFETTGGQQHILFSKATVGMYGATNGLYPVKGTNQAPSMSGGINVSSHSVGGVDITVPNFSLQATMYLASGCVTASYVDGLYNLTGKTNSLPWSPIVDGVQFDFQEGEALFLGASGAKRGIGDVEIGVHIAGSANATNITVGNPSGINITNIAKKGWGYLWVMTTGSVAPVESSGGGGTADAMLAIAAEQPAFAYVEKVYDEGGFSALGLPYAGTNSGG